MSAEWKVIFDVAGQWPPLHYLVAPLLAAALGALLRTCIRDRAHAARAPEPGPSGKSRGGPGGPRLVVEVVVGIGMGLALLVSVLTLYRYVDARHLLRSGAARVVEGPVRDFHPMPRAGHDTERFTVSGVKFQYPQNGVGFSQTAVDGGPIHDGLQVRLHYTATWGCEDICGATILRLEVKE